jgi:hypothetical protein
MVRRAVGLTWPLVFLCACSPAGRTFTAGSSDKVCQLTGQIDWSTGKPTTMASKPTNRGMDATDLGYPVEHNGRLALLFGDTRKIPPLAVDESGPADDAVGWITSESPPTNDTCTDLTLNAQFPSVVVSPRVLSPATIKQGLFNVPSGGVSKDGWLYAFFWTDHCNNGVKTPCPESEFLNSVGRGVLARSHDFGETFHDAVPMPRGFVYSTAVDATRIDTLAPGERQGTYVFGVPRYRDSVPYLAYAPEGKLLDPHSWKFFVSLRADGQPKWVTSTAWNNGDPFLFAPGPDLYPAAGQDRCVGEFSITWNRALRVWLLLYNCNLATGQSIVARTADAPWGPWSEGIVILSPSDPGAPCHLLMTPAGCEPLANYWPLKSDGTHDFGKLYAPGVMERYTVQERTFVPGRRRAAIYWLVSTWNPYQVMVMRTVLEVNTPVLFLSRDRPIRATRATP